jgi:hypothetical protein
MNYDLHDSQFSSSIHYPLHTFLLKTRNQKSEKSTLFKIVSVFIRKSLYLCDDITLNPTRRKGLMHYIKKDACSAYYSSYTWKIQTLFVGSIC